MPFSHHSHSGQFCKHGQGLLQDVLLEAIRQRFRVYGLTEHVPRYRTEDLYPEEEALSLTPHELAAQFEAFLDEAQKLKSLYTSPTLTVLVGLETEYITQTDLDQLDRLLHRRPGEIDYLVGSIHHVNGIPIDLDQPTFWRAVASCAGRDQEGEGGRNERDRWHPVNPDHTAFLEAYLDAQHTLLARFRPEIVGHFDLCRLYTPRLSLSSSSDDSEPEIHARHLRVQAKLERNIRLAVGYGALFEVNASAFGKENWSTAYPGEDVIQLILSHGGRLTLSDDSHAPHTVGAHYTRTAAYLRRLGVREMWYLTQHSSSPRASTVPINAAGRHVSAVKLDGAWWEHPFWSTPRLAEEEEKEAERDRPID